MASITQQLPVISSKDKHALFLSMRDYYENVGQCKIVNHITRALKAGPGYCQDIELYRELPDDATQSDAIVWQVVRSKENYNFYHAIFERYPHHITKYFANKYVNLFNNKGISAANRFLSKTLGHGNAIDHRLKLTNSQYFGGNTGLSTLFHHELAKLIEYNQNQISTLAKKMAVYVSDTVFATFLSNNNDFDLSCESLYSGTPAHEAYKDLINELKGLRINAPYFPHYKNNKLTEREALIAIAKTTDFEWWERQLKRRRDKQKEHLSIAVGQVQKNASAYSSWSCQYEWLEQKRNNREWAKNQVIENTDTGEQFELTLQIDKSNANPAIRRCELMVRMRGFEDIADNLGHAGVFVTLTAPSKYHSCHSKGGFVDNWNGANPQQTQAYLCGVWSKIRAKLSRENIRYYGFRVVEPHHDATPHWHLLVFIEPQHKDALKEIMQKYALEVDGDEPGALENRFKFVDIEKEKGSATGYIAKYISKNIDGYALDGEVDDETGEDLKKTAKAVTAWASRWRIRQFQQIGGAPVTTWRELRRLKEQKVEDENIDPVLAAASIASDWAAYTLLQGGATVKRENLTVRTAYEEKRNQFDEPQQKVTGIYSPITGLTSFICTRLIKWTIVKKTKEQKDVDLKNSAERAPWSSVNKCTESKMVIKPKKLSAIDKLIQDLELRDISTDEFIKNPTIRLQKPIKKELKDKLREQTYLEEIEKRNKQGRTTVVDNEKLKKQIINELKERNLLTKDYIISGLLAGHLISFNNNLAIKLVGCKLIYLTLPAYDSNDDEKKLMRTDMKSVMYGNIENMEKKYQTSKKEKKGYQKIYDNIIKDSKTVALDLLLKSKPKRQTFDDVVFDF